MIDSELERRLFFLYKNFPPKNPVEVTLKKGLAEIFQKIKVRKGKLS